MNTEKQLSEAASLITTALTEELGTAIAAIIVALKRQPGIDAEKLTADMEAYLSSFAKSAGKEAKFASMIVRLP